MKEIENLHTASFLRSSPEAESPRGVVGGKLIINLPAALLVKSSRRKKKRRKEVGRERERRRGRRTSRRRSRASALNPIIETCFFNSIVNSTTAQIYSRGKNRQQQ